MRYPSLSRAVEGFLLNVSASGRSHNTIRNYRTDLNRFTRYLENPAVHQVTSEKIKEFLSWFKNDYRITHVATTPIEPRKISKKTLRNAHGALSVFWKWVSKEFQLNNPFDVPPIKVYPKPISPLSEQEIKSLLSACKQSNKNPKNKKSYSSIRPTYKRDKAIILTLLDTGIRVSELCNIQVGDFYSENGRIIVTGKGSKTRFVYLGKVGCKAIWSYLLERFPNRQPLKDDPLYVNRNGIHPLSRNGVFQLVKRLGEKAGVQDVYPHRFRHTFAIEFLRNGGNVFELQQLLGHSDLEMSRRYALIAQIDLETSARKASPADRWRLR